jgi:hypothetical protein
MDFLKLTCKNKPILLAVDAIRAVNKRNWMFYLDGDGGR